MKDITASIHVWDADAKEIYTTVDHSGADRWYVSLTGGGACIYFWFSTKEEAEALALRLNGEIIK